MSAERFNRIEELILGLTNNISELRNSMDRRADAVEIRIKTLELDVEPEGRISQAFAILTEDLESFQSDVDRRFEQVYKRLDRLEHGQNEIRASLGLILEHLTRWREDSNN